MSKEMDLLKRILATGWLDHELSCKVEELLAQPEQEPVAWMHEGGVDETGETVRSIYQHLAPPKREPLSDKEIEDLWANKAPQNELECVRLVEKAHGIGGGE